MSNPFFDAPILNSPYEYPDRHWELDTDGLPTQRILERRRGADFETPAVPETKNTAVECPGGSRLRRLARHTRRL